MAKPLIITREINNPFYQPDHPETKDNSSTVKIQFRESSLDTMLRRNQIDVPQKVAGDRFRGIYERAGLSGLSAIDPAKDVVDGGKLYDGLTDCQVDALSELNRLAGVLGQIGFPIIFRICGDGENIGTTAEKYFGRVPSRREVEYIGAVFRDHLSVLAKHWGYKG